MANFYYDDNSGQQPHCTNCGAVVLLNAAACLSCGARPQGHRKFCAACGVSLNPEQVICIRCGVAVGGAAAVPQTGYQNNAQIDYAVNVPNRHEAVEKIRRYCSKLFQHFITSLVLYLITLLLLAAGFVSAFAENEEAAEGALAMIQFAGGVQFIAFIFLVVAAVYSFMLLYQLWKTVPQDVAAATPGSFVLVSPGLAVGLCFIPFFTFYWQFVAFWGLGKNLNRTLAGQGLSRRVSEWTGLTFCILNCFILIPYVNVLTSIAAFVFFLIYLNSLKNGAVALLEG